jgi:nucleoid-associated protein YgaU
LDEQPAARCRSTILVPDRERAGRREGEFKPWCENWWVGRRRHSALVRLLRRRGEEDPVEFDPPYRLARDDVVAVDDATVDRPSSSPAPTVPGTYVVQKGDSLDHMAKQFGITVAQLVAANKIKNPDHIEAGQRLTIPPATVAAVSTAPGSTTARKQATTSTTTHR